MGGESSTLKRIDSKRGRAAKKELRPWGAKDPPLKQNYGETKSSTQKEESSLEIVSPKVLTGTLSDLH